MNCVYIVLFSVGARPIIKLLLLMLVLIATHAHTQYVPTIELDRKRYTL
jgi:hypothetical protein